MLFDEQTLEEIEIEKAIQLHEEARHDERVVFGLAVVLYVVGVVMWIFWEGRTATTGMAVMLCSVLALAVHAVLSYRTAMRKLKAKDLASIYLRRQAVPFYQELREIFADKPGVQIYLQHNGVITVTDKRKKEGGNHGSK